MKFEEITGFRIKKLRNEKKISQTELAKILNVSQSTITAWENSKQQPSIEKLNFLAQFFEVDTNYLTGIDLETRKDINKLTNSEYIYSKSNVLTKEEINNLSKDLQKINILKEKIRNSPLKKSYSFYTDLISTKNSLLEKIISNDIIKENLFNINYKKNIYDIKSETTLDNNIICSQYQKAIINEILEFNNQQCIYLGPYIYHLKKNKNISTILYNISCMRNNEIETLNMYIQNKNNQITENQQNLINKLIKRSDKKCKRVNDFIN